MPSGAKIQKSEFRARCIFCKPSTEPGWLWLGGGDWVVCPGLCNKGWISGLETKILPTRKIILPSANVESVKG